MILLLFVRDLLPKLVSNLVIINISINSSGKHILDALSLSLSGVESPKFGVDLL